MVNEWWSTSCVCLEVSRVCIASWGFEVRKSASLASAALAVSLSIVGTPTAHADHNPGLPEEGRPGLVITDVQRATVGEKVRATGPGLRFRASDAFDLVTLEAVFQAGSSAGWHTHPGPVFVLVRSGTLTVWDENCETRTYGAGEGFVERGPHHSMLVKNEGAEDSEIYATLVVPVGADPLSIPAPHLCGIEE